MRCDDHKIPLEVVHSEDVLEDDALQVSCQLNWWCDQDGIRCLEGGMWHACDLGLRNRATNDEPTVPT